MQLKSMNQILTEVLQYAGVDPVKILGEDAVVSESELSEAASGVKKAIANFGKAQKVVNAARKAIGKAVEDDLGKVVKGVRVKIWPTSDFGIFRFTVQGTSTRDDPYGGMDKAHAAMKSYGMFDLHNEDHGGGDYQVTGSMDLRKQMRI